jgi:antitoxin component YwqK of YwqJK toxin-antitoxin module
MSRSLVFILLCFVFVANIKAQESALPNGDSITKFYYPNGQLSSEGTMRDGKPDGYWKTYNEKGFLKSEGNRKFFLLDSVWKFYDDSARLLVSITYLADKKNGLKTTYREGEIVSENFVNDVKQGPTTYYYPDGKVRLIINFVSGLENGVARELAPDGSVITYMEYKKGFLVSRERINRKDSKGLKQGRWKYFYDNFNLKLEGVYKDDKRMVILKIMMKTEAYYR